MMKINNFQHAENLKKFSSMKKLMLYSILLVLVLSIFATVFVLAEESNAEPDESDIDKRLVVIRPFAALMGYAEKEDGTDARHIRLWIGKVKIFPLTQDIVNESKEIRRQYKDDKETMKEKLKELAQKYKENDTIDSYQGILVVGRGKEHVTYRVLSKEVSNETASFYILEKDVVSENSTKTEKKGFFWGLGKRLGLVKEQVIINPEDTSNLNIIGEFSLNGEKFESIHLWKGSMILDEGIYEGSWNLDLMSAGFLWWPHPGLHKAFASGQQKDKENLEEAD